MSHRLGLFLQGGGAHGAWQAAVLETLTARGARFDAVMGFSIGAANGAALALGRLPEALARWRALDGGALSFRPSLAPFGLFTLEPLRAFLGEGGDEAAKAAISCELTVVAASREDGSPVNARFTPGGRGGWDGPLVEHVLASCAIPVVFPPVDVHYRGRRLRLVDGGVPMPAPIDLAPLSGCSDILVVEMVREDEAHRPARSPWRAFDRRGRLTCRRLVDEALRGLETAAPSAKVHRLAPSLALQPMQLDFRAAGLRAMLDQGASDAQDFLRGAGMFLVR